MELVGLVVADETGTVGLEVQFAAQTDAEGGEIDERRTAEGLVDAVTERALLAGTYVEIILLILRQRELGGLDE